MTGYNNGNSAAYELDAGSNQPNCPLGQPFTSQGAINSENNVLQDNHNLAAKASSITSYTAQQNLFSQGDNTNSGIAEKRMQDSMATPVIQSNKIVGSSNEPHKGSTDVGTGGPKQAMVDVLGEKPQTMQMQRQKPNFTTTNVQSAAGDANQNHTSSGMTL